MLLTCKSLWNVSLEGNVTKQCCQRQWHVVFCPQGNVTKTCKTDNNDQVMKIIILALLLTLCCTFFVVTISGAQKDTNNSTFKEYFLNNPCFVFHAISQVTKIHDLHQLTLPPPPQRSKLLPFHAHSTENGAASFNFSLE